MAKIEYKETLIKSIQNSDTKTTKMILDNYGHDNLNELLKYMNEGDLEMLKLLVDKGARIPDFVFSNEGQREVLKMDLVNKLIITLVKII